MRYTSCSLLTSLLLLVADLLMPVLVQNKLFPPFPWSFFCSWSCIYLIPACLRPPVFTHPIHMTLQSLAVWSNAFNFIIDISLSRMSVFLDVYWASQLNSYSAWEIIILRLSGPHTFRIIILRPSGVSTLPLIILRPSGLHIIRFITLRPSGVNTLPLIILRPSGLNTIHFIILRPSGVSTLPLIILRPSGLQIIRVAP